MSRAVKIASLLYMVSIFLSRIIGMIREGVIGRILGESGEADVYWVAFILPDFLNYLLAGGALSLVFIPLLQSAEKSGGEEERWACFWRVSTPLSLLMLIFTVIAWCLIDRLTPLLAPGFTTSQHALLSHLTRIILPAQFFHLCGGLLSATLQAKDQHMAPALAPLLYTGSVIAGGLLLGPTLGAEGFAWGVLIGSIIGPFGCPLIANLLSGLSLRPTWDPTHREVRAYLWRALPVMLGFSVVVLDEMIVKHLGTGLEEGAVSQLHYARTLLRVPMGVFGLALGMAAFPTLSRLCAMGERRQAYVLLSQAVEVLLLLAGLSQVLLTVTSAELAAIIWGREVMSDSGLMKIGLYCGGLSIGLWAWSLQGLVARGFYAQGQTWRPTLIGSLVMFSFLPIYHLSSSYHAFGLTLASSAAISTYVIFLWVMVSRSLDGDPLSLLRPILKVGVSVLFGILISHYISLFLDLPRAGLGMKFEEYFDAYNLSEMFNLSTTHPPQESWGESWREGWGEGWGGIAGLLFLALLKGGVGVVVCLFMAWRLRLSSVMTLSQIIWKRLKRS